VLKRVFDAGLPEGRGREKIIVDDNSTDQTGKLLQESE
jgi:glycosyltransferase involved in cell wall biosynthesis